MFGLPDSVQVSEPRSGGLRDYFVSGKHWGSGLQFLPAVQGDFHPVGLDLSVRNDNDL